MGLVPCLLFPSPNDFVAPGSARSINGLWFASLVLSLSTALLCILIKRWLNNIYLAGFVRARLGTLSSIPIRRTRAMESSYHYSCITPFCCTYLCSYSWRDLWCCFWPLDIATTIATLTRIGVYWIVLYCIHPAALDLATMSISNTIALPNNSPPIFLAATLEESWLLLLRGS